MYLLEVLEKLSKEEIKDIARREEIPGFSKLKKSDLIDLVCNNLYVNKELFKEIFYLCRPSQRYFLNILSKKRNGMAKTEKIKSEFLEKYSKATFFDAYNELLSIFFVFEILNNDFEDISLIPSDFLPYLRKLFKQENIESEIENIEVIDSSKISSIEDILFKIKKEELKNFCEKKNMLKGGRKEELIKRIMELNNPNTILTVARKPILQWACEELNCDSNASKKELRDRLLMKLIPGYKPIVKKKIDKIITKNIDEDDDEEQIDDDEYKINLIKSQNLVKRIKATLEITYLDVKGLRKEESLESSLFTALKMAPGLKNTKISRGSATKKENKLQPDIYIENADEKVCIEAKFIDQRHPRQTINELKVQLVDFKADYPDYDFIVFLFDKAGKMESQDRNRIKYQVSNYVYKTQDDYEGDD